MVPNLHFAGHLILCHTNHGISSSLQTIGLIVKLFEAIAFVQVRFESSDSAVISGELLQTSSQCFLSFSHLLLVGMILPIALDHVH